MISLLLLALGSTLVLAQPPFTRLTQTIASTPFTVSSPGIVTPSTTQLTSPVLASMNPGQLSSTLQYPQSLTNQLNMPNIQGLSQPSFTDPFAPAATTPQTNSGLLSGMLPSGLSNNINSLTSPFTNANAAPGTATTPITSTLSNLFGSAPATTTTTLASPFSTSNPAPATNTNLFPLDSTLFPSAFSPNTVAIPTSTMIQPQSTIQAQAPQLSTLSANPPNFQSNTNAGPQAPSSPFSSPQPQSPTQPRAPTQPQAPSAPQAPSQPQGPSQPQQPQAPSITSFNPAAINGPSMPSTGFTTQAAPPALSNNSPFAPQSPGFPSVGNAPIGSGPSPPQQPQQPSGPILLESASSPVRQAAPVVVRGNAPAMSPFPSSPQLP